MASAILFAGASASAPAAAPAPQRLAIFYGIPSLVNGAAGDVARAAQAFAEYDVVVFGDGLEFDDVVATRKPAGAGAVEYQRTKAIIARLADSPRRTTVFGYVDLGRSQQLTLDDIKLRVQRWRAAGASGIFFDEAGADFGVDRARQNAAVDAVHAAGLHAVLNAFDPDDVFQTAADRIKPKLGSGDAYLLESFAVRNGRADDPRGWNDRTPRAVAGTTATGAALWATTTMHGAYDPALMEHAWHAARQAGIQAFAWGEPGFGSADSRLPFRPRPQ